MTAFDLPLSGGIGESGSPVSGSGELLLADLANRADRAYAIHLDGYTASSVLHLLWMDTADEDLRATLNVVFSVLESYHEVTRKAWYDAYNEWAAAAGVEQISDDTDGSDDSATAFSDSTDKVVTGNAE
ncbi:hypothetical protein UG55_108421 [Frankia sp. EI5c]|uniref:hypothetical protein n=1 Tax=Frankia sp. EI5c TaxID=683316 RepID=UPI0007C3BD7D|nr:hypothetical protein [Frankia sp. EI5c]OAA19870.1 hypothetical protein UG55_108421 [Frankia sp. EI5c]